MDLNLKDRVYIVTGASRGLGEACVRAIAAEGGKVLAAARSREDLERIQKDCGATVAIAPCDMRDRNAVAALVDMALEKFGRLDGIVNNAGIAPAGSFESQDLAVFDEVLAVNLLAPAALAQRAGAHWIGTAGVLPAVTHLVVRDGGVLRHRRRRSLEAVNKKRRQRHVTLAPFFR